jgi:CubicO group peptidase (beta-lactamase class C family)
VLNWYRLEQTIEHLMEKEHIPGLAVAVVKDEEVIYARGFGVTSTEDPAVSVTPQTLFRIGSITKPLVGTAVMRLVESGLLDLDRPVKEYIEWLTFSEKGATERMTLRLLMSHTSGLPRDAQLFGRRGPDGLEMYVREKIPSYSFVAPPGKLYAYSNPGINLVGYIAQVACGKPFTTFMQELLFDPLEMKRTTFDPTIAMTYPLAQSHVLLKEGTLHVEHRFADNTAYYPSGSAYSTVLDLCNFAMIHLHQGRFREKSILSPQSAAKMHTPFADEYVLADSRYGLTLKTLSYKGLKCVEHNGEFGTFGCHLAFVPDRRLACVLMLNRIPSKAAPLVYLLLDSLLDLPKEVAKPQAIEPDRTLWENYAGTYLGNRTGIARISIENNQLTLMLNGQTIPLQAYRTNLYAGQRQGNDKMISVGFIPEEVGPTQYLMIDGSSKVCKRVILDTHFVPDPSLWISYVGRYQSDDGEVITIRIVGNQLMLHFRDSDTIEEEGSCLPVDATRFVWERGLLEFQVAQDGSVPEIVVMGVYTLRRI